jgi:hypothetical protein
VLILTATVTNKRSYVAGGLVDGLIKIYGKGEIARFEFVSKLVNSAVCLTIDAQSLLNCT